MNWRYGLQSVWWFLYQTIRKNFFYDIENDLVAHQKVKVIIFIHVVIHRVYSQFLCRLSDTHPIWFPNGVYNKNLHREIYWSFNSIHIHSKPLDLVHLSIFSVEAIASLCETRLGKQSLKRQCRNRCAASKKRILAEFASVARKLASELSPELKANCWSQTRDVWAQQSFTLNMTAGRHISRGI